MVKSIDTKAEPMFVDKVKNLFFDLGMYLFNGVPLDASKHVNRGNLITYSYIPRELIEEINKSIRYKSDNNKC